MKRKLIFVFFLIVAFLFLEVFLRSYFGFCDNVLIQEDPNFEYIAQPNQKRFRFRNHIIYNSKSMRSEEVDASAYVIVGFGDSVINGGVLTDQSSLATTILSDTLSKLFGEKVQFLNISAGSWGPDNCYAYLEEYGDFGANAVFLFVSSHDAYDNMNFEKIVDVNESFLSKQYSFALYELTDKYLFPRIRNMFAKSESNSDNLGINKRNESSLFNSGFLSFHSYTRNMNIPFVIYLHPDIKEVLAGSYNQDGQEIIEFAKANNIDLILGLDNGFDVPHYRDGIHINSKGQRKLTESILEFINETAVLSNNN